jgi:hypothetical protein
VLLDEVKRDSLRRDWLLGSVDSQALLAMGEIFSGGAVGMMVATWKYPSRLEGSMMNVQFPARPMTVCVSGNEIFGNNS